MDLYTIKSNFDNLPLEILVIKPVTNIIGIIQISHGMAEHKERYIDFGNYVSKQGYICVIHDHRGHGNSTLSKQHYGHFYTDNENAIVEDLYQVSCWIKDSYPGYPLYLFSHSMGTLVSRIYLKKYDSFINKLILCGPPTKNSSVFLGLGIAKLFNIFYPKTKPNHILNYLTFHSYEKNFPVKNKWLSKNIKNVYEYNQDEKCGFIFTTNGFINLVINHQFNWWFDISPPKGYCYCSPKRAVSQALLLVR